MASFSKSEHLLLLQAHGRKPGPRDLVFQRNTGRLPLDPIHLRPDRASRRAQHTPASGIARHVASSDLLDDTLALLLTAGPGSIGWMVRLRQVGRESVRRESSTPAR